jgi:hypothetical protein
VSTASRNYRNHVQRLQERGNNAPQSSGSRRLVPWVLRPMCLQWLSNSGGKHQAPCDPEPCKCKPEAKTAASSTSCRMCSSEKSDNPGSRPGQAFSGTGGVAAPNEASAPKRAGARGGCRALSLTPLLPSTLRSCRLEAMAGTSPPPSLTLRCTLRSNVPRRATNSRAAL